MIKQALGDKLFHILHDILDSYFIIHTCRLKEIDSLRGTKDAVDIVDASAQDLDAASRKCKLAVSDMQYLHTGVPTCLDSTYDCCLLSEFSFETNETIVPSSPTPWIQKGSHLRLS